MGVSTLYVTSCRNADLQRAEEEQRSGLHVLRSGGRKAGVQVRSSSSSQLKSYILCFSVLPVCDSVLLIKIKSLTMDKESVLRW